MKYQNIVVAGGGTLGSQVAFQCAYCGFNVKIWLYQKECISQTQERLDNLQNTYIETIHLMETKEGKSAENWARGISEYTEFDEEECLQRVERAYKSIQLELDLKKSVEDADLLIESLPENQEIKTNFYKMMAPLLPEKTVVVTNASTILPSKFAQYTGRPEQFLALHFANSIWKNNMTEVMAQSKTNIRFFDEILAFAREIRMIPLPVKKEKAGYLLNSMLLPLLFSAMDLYVNGVSDPESIDCAWTYGTNAAKGPFQILDKIGIKTVYDVVMVYVKMPSFLAPYNFKGMQKMLKQYISEGKLGEESGEGFYKYN